MAWLINDVVSYFAPYTPYGKAGTEVVILHDHHDMMIVQDAAGNTFHSRTDNLSDTPPAKPAPLKANQPVEQPVMKSRTPKKKSPSANQSNLF
jgi:hypothetical protein